MPGFSGLSFGPQHQKGDALKEYVRVVALYNSFKRITDFD
jgi:hypothetical protein